MADMVKDHKTFDEYVMEAQWDIPGQMANWQKRPKPDRNVEKKQIWWKITKRLTEILLRLREMSLVKWWIGKNGQNLTEKLKKSRYGERSQKDWNLIETPWDVPGRMVKLTKMTNQAETERTCQEGEKLWIWQEKSRKSWRKLKWGSKRCFGKIANLVKYAKTWPKGWKREIWPKNYQIAEIE